VEWELVSQLTPLDLRAKAKVIRQMTSSITSKFRGWCFTLNNYNLIDEDHIRTTIKTLARYVVYGREIAPETGTPHLQGYVYFHNQRQRKAVSRLLPRARVEPANGSAAQNRIYCTKEDDFWEHGDIPMEQDVARGKGGAANAARYSTAIASAKAGRLADVERDDPQLFLLHGIRLESLYAPDTKPLDGDLLHEWWVGPSGSGKSRLLWELYPQHFAKALNKWWDGYKHEDVIAIEEWAPKNDCTASSLKKWADRYPFPGEIKGGCKQRLRPKKIIVLSNYTPQQCFLNSEDLEPILRRFTVMYFPKEEQHARYRALAMVEEKEDEENPPSLADTPLPFSIGEDLELPDLDLNGDFFN